MKVKESLMYTELKIPTETPLNTEIPNSRLFGEELVPPTPVTE